MNRRNPVFLTFLFATLLFLSSCNNQKVVEYDTVKIGTQIWMAKNLNVSTYRNGDTIPHVQDASEWARLKTGAWCYYKNNPKYGDDYGKLYNWFAVSDPRGLAPDGYHIPSDAEWTILTDFLGGSDSAGTKMKSTSHWYEGSGTNESGFNGLPGGEISGFGTFARMGGFGRWWSSTQDGEFAYLRMLHYFKGSVGRNAYDLRTGYSVRCIQDNSN